MRMFQALALAALAGCQPIAPAASDGQAARELAGRSAGEPQTCVSTFEGQSLRPLDRRTVAYGFGSTVFVNRLDADCSALAPNSTIIVEASGSQFCRGDRLRGLEAGASIPGPVCILRDWTPYRRP